MKHPLTLNLARLLALVALFMTGIPYIMAETVEVKTPGTLRQIIYELDSPEMTSLTIVGALNSADLKYIADGEGDIANLKSIDLSEVTLISGGDAYASTRYGGQFSVTLYFFISDEEEQSYAGSSNWLGTVNSNYNYYGDHLAGLFANHKNLEYVRLPKYLKAIAPFTFHKCTNLKEVNFPNTIKEVGEGAFYQSGISSLVLPDGVRTIAPNAFYLSSIQNIPIPASVDSIGNYAFYGSSISTIDLSHVKKIGRNAFTACRKLSGRINLSNIDSIPKNLFELTAINEVVFSNKLTFIGECAFKDCESLESVPVIPTTLKEIEKDAFRNTPWLTSNNGENGVMYLNDIAYQYKPQTASETLSFKEGTTQINCGFTPDNDEIVKKIIFPKTVVTIGNNAFQNMKSLRRVQWSENIKSIGDYAFNGCSNLGFEKLPDSLVEIGESAFNGCNNIFSLTLPKGLKTIGYSAFAYCSGLISCTLRSSNLMGPQFLFCTNSNSNTTLTDVTIGVEVDTVPKWFLYQCNYLQTITFEDRPNGKPINFGEYCFGTSWKSIVNCPKNMENIGNVTFYRASFPGELSLEGTKVIGESAFAESSGYSYLLIPEGVEIIHSHAFRDVDIKTVELRATNVRSQGSTFGDYFSVGSYRPNYSIEKVIIGNNVEYLNGYMFGFCSGLKDIEFEPRDKDSYVPLTVGLAFYFSENKKDHNQIYYMELPYGTIRCSPLAFGYWIKGLTFPSTFQEFIGGGRLYDLESIHCYATTPPKGFGSIELRQFYKDYKQVNVYVPAESVEAYKSDEEWGRCNIIGLPPAAVDTIVSDSESITDIYTLTGYKMPDRNIEKMPQGVYIVRYSSGRTDKVCKH